MASGVLISADDALLTLSFPAEELPFVFGRLTAGDESLCVLRVRPDGTVYAIAATGTTVWTLGQTVVDSGGPFLQTLPDWIAANLVGKVDAETVGLPTGLKTIDVFTPLVRGGRTGVFGEWGVAMFVLVAEIVRRLDGPQRILVFSPAVQDEKQWRGTNGDIPAETGSVEVWYIPVEAPTSEAFVDRIFALEAKLIVTKALSKHGIFPQIDPVRSRGRAVGGVAQDVVELFRRNYSGQFEEIEGESMELMRARFALRFLSQPFYVAEPYTGVPGVWVDAAEAERTFGGILNGIYDDFPPPAFYMKGGQPVNPLV